MIHKVNKQVEGENNIDSKKKINKNLEEKVLLMKMFFNYKKIIYKLFYILLLIIINEGLLILTNSKELNNSLLQFTINFI